jgi:hypothetical protein
MRPAWRSAAMLWRPRRPLPPWLRRYHFVEVPVPSTDVPAVTLPFRAGMAAIPSCLAVQGLVVALQGAGVPASGWVGGEAGLPAFTYSKRAGTITTVVQPLPPAGRLHGELGGPWETVRRLDDLDADVLLIALACALDGPHEAPDGTSWLTADALLEARGIRPKTEGAGALRYRAGHRREDRLRVSASMEHLDQLWVRLQDVELRDAQPGKRAHTGRFTGAGKVLLITDRLVQDGAPVAWRLKPGPWLASFLGVPNRQTALLPQQALRYDPYHRRWEKRLARYLTFHLRMDARHGRALVRRVGPLLDELCLTVDWRHPERTRARLEAALTRLARDGLIGGWDYTAASRVRLAVLPVRHWMPQWRAATIAVTAATPVAAHYARLRRPSRRPVESISPHC